MKRIILLSIALLLSFSLSSTAMYFSLNNTYTYDTNAFSDPLPQNAGETFLQNAEYLKRHNVGLNFTFDTFFSPKSRTGLSVSTILSLPFKSTTFKPEGDLAGDWEYVPSDSLSEQKIAFFFSVGPVFRAAFEKVDLSLALRASVGSYDFFTTGVVMGLQAQPFVNFFINDGTYLSFGLLYDAHMMKFIYDEKKIYEDHYIMLSAGAYIGLGIVVGER